MLMEELKVKTYLFNIQIFNLESVASALSQESSIKVDGLGVERVPFSGPPEELYRIFGLDSGSIEGRIRKIIN